MLVGMTESALFWCLLVIQLLGGAALVLARWEQRCTARCLCQLFFVGSLLAVGGGTIVAYQSSSPIWLSCGITLASMVVGATLDTTAQSQPLAF